MKVLEALFDERSDCISILTSMTLMEYKEITFDAFESGGNLEGQRDVIKRSTVASKIRKRMHDDFVAGAIFPHVVIGLLSDLDKFKLLKENSEMLDIAVVRSCNISIIDGMQRSNIYFSNYEGNEERTLRVEFWITDKAVKLLYRMLVLNTGQVRWNTKRQIEVIFSNLFESIIGEVRMKNPDLAKNIQITSVDDQKRRTQAGKYKKSTIIELYLGYNTRSVKVDVNDELADEFQRFDMIESIEKDENFNFFIDAFIALCMLDFEFSLCNSRSDGEGQYKEGKDIFGSNPACIGFIVACAEYVLGGVSAERNDEKKHSRNKSMKEKIDLLISKLQNTRNEDFLALDVFNECMSPYNKNKSSRIGDEMRVRFKDIFLKLLKDDDLDELKSMESLWRPY